MLNKLLDLMSLKVHIPPMIDALREFFSTSAFMPHGHCYLWKKELVWAMVTTDLLIGFSYIFISFGLYSLTRKIKLQFSAMFLAFGVFIAACGATHFMEVWTLWYPSYWTAVLIKALTAVASIATAIYTIPIHSKAVLVSEATRESETRRKLLEEQAGHLYKANEELRKSQERLSLFFKEIKDYAIFMLDPDGKITSWNEGARKITGYDAEHILGEHFSKFYQENDVSSGKCSYQLKEASFTGRYEDECWHVRKDHSLFWANAVVTALRDEKNRLIGFSKILRDITEKKRTEDKLRLAYGDLERRVKEQTSHLHQSENQMRLITNALPVHISYISPEQKYTFVNAAYEKSFGLERKSMLNKPVREILGTRVYEMRRPYIEAALKGQEVRFEGIIPTREGKDIYATGHYIPDFDELGNVRGIIVLVQDISDAKHAEELIRQNEERFRKIVEYNNDGLLIVDSEGTIRFSNPMAKRLFDRDIGTLVGEAFGYPLGLNKKLELQLQQKSGEIVTVDVQTTPLEWEGSSAYLVILHDITSQKKAAMEMDIARKTALEASEMKSSFLANMSHEIRTPLNAILGMADLLLETTIDDEQKSHLILMNRASKTLLTLIDDILDLSKVEAGQVQLENIDFNLHDMIKTIVSLMEVKANEKKLSIILEFDPEVSPHVKGDPNRLSQILLNLLGNAIKFTQSGKVLLSVKRKGLKNGMQDLDIRVHDNGIGIPKEKLEAIFERFTQSDASTTRRFGGSGLGLAIAKKLLELMGGTIHAESDVGRGSTFVISLALPNATEKLSDSQSSKQSSAVASSQQKTQIVLPPLRILLVEDYEENQKVCLAMLKSSPHRIALASNGQEGIEKFKNEIFDIVLMDIQMPVVDGYTATKAIRAWEKENDRKPVPIIALTANAYKEEIQKSLSVGCNAHISKPVTKTVLLTTIAENITRAGGARHDIRLNTEPTREN